MRCILRNRMVLFVAGTLLFSGAIVLARNGCAGHVIFGFLRFVDTAVDRRKDLHI